MVGVVDAVKGVVLLSDSRTIGASWAGLCALSAPTRSNVSCRQVYFNATLPPRLRVIQESLVRPRFFVIPCPFLGNLGATLQIVDSGADQESCFFRDIDGESVEGGYYFEELAIFETLVGTSFFVIFLGGFFPFDLDRRKVCVD